MLVGFLVSMMEDLALLIAIDHSPGSSSESLEIAWLSKTTPTLLIISVAWNNDMGLAPRSRQGTRPARNFCKPFHWNFGRMQMASCRELLRSPIRYQGVGLIGLVTTNKRGFVATFRVALPISGRCYARYFCRVWSFSCRAPVRIVCRALLRSHAVLVVVVCRGRYAGHFCWKSTSLTMACGGNDT